jgi:hypothetical protein
MLRDDVISEKDEYVIHTSEKTQKCKSLSVLLGVSKAQSFQSWTKHIKC